VTHRFRARQLLWITVAGALGISYCLGSELTGAGRSRPEIVSPSLVSLHPRNLAPRHSFGNSVAMDLDTAVVGAPGDSSGGGAAYVFARTLTGEWQEQAQLTRPDGLSADEFGTSVAVASETALVGTGVSDSPAAYVFVRNGLSWTPQARLEVARGVMSVALSASGDRAVVGVAGGANPTIEAAYVFARHPGGKWVPEAVLTPNPGTPPGGGFGYSVSISEDAVAVGAQGENSSNGAVYVFERSADGSWHRQMRLAFVASGHSAALFGWSVGLSGRTLMVGAFGENGFRGAAYIFQQTPAGLWPQQARLVPDDPAPGYQCFGLAIGLTLYGALISQPCDGGSGLTTRVYVLSRDSNGAWSRRLEVSSPVAASTANFGAALATNGLDVVIGSPSEEPSGAAYVLECLPCLLYGAEP
jgi:hypothetical protein